MVNISELCHEAKITTLYEIIKNKRNDFDNLAQVYPNMSQKGMLGCQKTSEIRGFYFHLKKKRHIVC